MNKSEIAAHENMRANAKTIWEQAQVEQAGHRARAQEIADRLAELDRQNQESAEQLLALEANEARALAQVEKAQVRALAAQGTLYEDGAIRELNQQKGTLQQQQNTLQAARKAAQDAQTKRNEEAQALMVEQSNLKDKLKATEKQIEQGSALYEEVNAALGLALYQQAREILDQDRQEVNEQRTILLQKLLQSDQDVTTCTDKLAEWSEHVEALKAEYAQPTSPDIRILQSAIAHIECLLHEAPAMQEGYLKQLEIPASELYGGEGHLRDNPTMLRQRERILIHTLEAFKKHVRTL